MNLDELTDIIFEGKEDTTFQVFGFEIALIRTPRDTGLIRYTYTIASPWMAINYDPDTLLGPQALKQRIIEILHFMFEHAPRDEAVLVTE